MLLLENEMYRFCAIANGVPIVLLKIGFQYGSSGVYPCAIQITQYVE